jgi:hypothetical protein
MFTLAQIKLADKTIKREMCKFYPEDVVNAFDYKKTKQMAFSKDWLQLVPPDFILKKYSLCSIHIKERMHPSLYDNYCFKSKELLEQFNNYLPEMIILFRAHSCLSRYFV